MVSIFEYTDFYKYLRDVVADTRQRSRVMNQRTVAGRLGVDPGNFSRTLKGNRRLPHASLGRLAALAKLNRREQDYMQILYGYNHARSHTEKKRLFEQMLSFRESRVRHVDSDRYEFYDKWYYTAVREALAFFAYDGSNGAELGKLIIPALSVQQVERAIAMLDRLGLIRRDTDGCWRRADAVISSGPDARSIALNNFVINMMQLAAQSIERAPEQIMLSSTSLTISEEVYREIEEEIRHLRRKALEMARDCRNPDRVYQLNIQHFPLTRPAGPAE